MKLKSPITINFLDFFKRGKFDFIKLGQTKEWILNNFPDPDDYNTEFIKRKFAIWRYGNIEFHFNDSNELFLIYSDYISTLNGGKNLLLEKWILTDYNKLKLSHVLAELNKESIDYKKKVPIK